MTNKFEKVTFLIKANQVKRTFTIRKYVNNRLGTKYRTLPMSKEEFESSEMNKDNDWKEFLKGDNYVKL